jgi:hypothetical protein
MFISDPSTPSPIVPLTELIRITDGAYVHVDYAFPNLLLDLPSSPGQMPSQMGLLPFDLVRVGLWWRPSMLVRLLCLRFMAEFLDHQVDVPYCAPVSWLVHSSSSLTPTRVSGHSTRMIHNSQVLNWNAVRWPFLAEHEATTMRPDLTGIDKVD